MASVTLLLGLLLASIAIAGAQSIGVSYGRDANNLPPPSEVVALYRQYNIGRMRIYDPNQQVLQALRGSNIELVLGVPNPDLENLANNPAAAPTWVQANVRSYYPDVRIRYIAVGTEVTRDGRATPHVVRAMTNIYNAVQAAGLGQIRVSTVIDTSVIADGTSYPPSRSVFRSDLMWLLNPIIGFLTDTRAPLFVNIYPYFAYDLKLPFRLFTNPSVEFTDTGNNLQYQNLFDAELDGVYAALEKASGSSLRVVVTESGWPSARGRGASIGNARTYNQNLINHVRRGSPKKPGMPIETYLFAMFNENLKSPDYENNFGLFYPDKRPVYPINFS